jgi:hypothetical protein
MVESYRSHQGELMDDKKRSAGYLWRPGSSPQDDPLHIVVAVVICLIIVGAVVAAVLT